MSRSNNENNTNASIFMDLRLHSVFFIMTGNGHLPMSLDFTITEITVLCQANFPDNLFCQEMGGRV